MGSWAAIGGLNVQSNLGEPFSGSIIVTGQEAQALLRTGVVSVSGGDIHGEVVPQNNGDVVVRLRSSSNIYEPVISFVVKAGTQTRQYTALINPPQYSLPKESVQPKATKIIADSRSKIPQSKVTKSSANTQENIPSQGTRQSTVYHSIQRGETLSDIADKYRPDSLSKQRAMRVLIAANPKAFRAGSNGDVMYHNATLYIPTESEFYAYANLFVPKKKLTRTEKESTSSTQQAVEEKKEKSLAVENVETVDLPKDTAKEITEPEPALVKKEHQHAENTDSVAALEEGVLAPELQKQAEEEVVSEVVELEVEANHAEPEAIETDSHKEKVQTQTEAEVKKPVTQATENVPEVAGETDWTLLGGAGLGGLVLLGGLGYLFVRRRTSNSISDNQIESVATDDVQVRAVALAKESNKDSQASSFDIAEGEFFVDNFEQKDQKQNSDFDLEEFSPEVSRSESDEYNEFVTIDDHVQSELGENDDGWEWDTDNEQVDDEVNIEFQEESVASREEYVSNIEHHDEISVSQEPVSSDDEWIDQVLVIPSDDVSDTLKNEEQDEDDIVHVEFKDDDHDVLAESDAELTADVSNVDSHIEFQEHIEDEHVAHSQQPAVVDDVLTFTADDYPVESVSLEKEQTIDSESITLAPEDTFLDFSTEFEQETHGVHEEQSVNLEQDGHHLDFALDDVYADEQVDDSDNHAVETVEIDETSLNAVEISDSEKEVVDTDSINVSIPEVSTAVTDLDWDESTHLNDHNSVGFVSEAVGMTAPQEAKFELAKMYLEIDDAVAARETLRELITESSGELQERAKKLLDELGG